jgi:hypothetical protein
MLMWRRDIETINLDFLSKDCKNNNHLNCNIKWEGLGIQVACRCSCNHDKKISRVSQVVSNSSTDTSLDYNDHNRCSRTGRQGST